MPWNGRKYDCYVQLGEVLHTHVRGPRSEWKIYIALALKKMKVVLMPKKRGGKKVLPKNKCPKLMPPISTLLVSELLT